MQASKDWWFIDSKALDNEADFSISGNYPTITEGMVIIDLTNFRHQVEEIVVFDVQGRKLESFNSITNELPQLDLNLLPSGMYFIKVDDFIAKIIKQ